MVEVDALAKRYGVRPSEFIKGKIEQYQFDLLAASVGVEDEARQQKKALDRSKSRR